MTVHDANDGTFHIFLYRVALYTPPLHQQAEIFSNLLLYIAKHGVKDVEFCVMFRHASWPSVLQAHGQAAC